MNSKFRLLAVASMVVVMASGCSSYRGASQAGINTTAAGTYANGQATGATQVARTGQVARGGFGQQRTGTAAVHANDSCAVCAASKAQNTYTYKPPVATKPAPVAQPQRTTQTNTNTSRHNQQFYIDRWNRQQAQQQQRTVQRPAAPKPVQQNTNYAGYGQNQQQSNTTYYDYSTAARTATPAPAATSAATSNKSIYTGSYQQKTYTPTTYAGGSSATTSSATTVASAGGAGSYVVKKGDTVFEIMRQTGVYWKDIISLNSLTPPYNINPGQNLRLK